MLGNLFAPLAMKIAGGVAVALAVALGVQTIRANHWHSEAAEAREDLKTAEATITLLRVDAELKETAAVERQEDTAEVAEMEKELIDAIKDVPDEKPDAVRVALGCKRLRAQGYREADLPAPCRSGS